MGHYECSCSDGFVVGGDARSCEGITMVMTKTATASFCKSMQILTSVLPLMAAAVRIASTSWEALSALAEMGSCSGETIRLVETSMSV